MNGKYFLTRGFSVYFMIFIFKPHFNFIQPETIKFVITARSVQIYKINEDKNAI